jgi:5-methyltetrahydrofolate--homocysteine methyltransferase
MFDARPIFEALMAGDEEALIEKARTLLEEGVPASQILKEGLIAGMDIVGEKMENEDLFIPEVLMSAKAMAGAIALLKPQLAEEEVEAVGKVVIGTVKGDLHDIGKNLVVMMLESVGFEVYDLGVDVPPAKFVAAVKEKGANLLGLSALLTTTMPMMRQTLDAVKAGGLRDHVKVLVGGAPVTQNFATDIGADGYAPDAGSAARMAKALLESRPR